MAVFFIKIEEQIKWYTKIILIAWNVKYFLSFDTCIKKLYGASRLGAFLYVTTHTCVVSFHISSIFKPIRRVNDVPLNFPQQKAVFSLLSFVTQVSHVVKFVLQFLQCHLRHDCHDSIVLLTPRFDNEKAQLLLNETQWSSWLELK